MRILVTGANGRLGRALRSSHLLEPENEVAWVVRPGDSTAPHDLPIDLSAPQGIEDAIATTRPDAVIHLAAALGPAVDPVYAATMNVGLVDRVARASAESGVSHMVFVSSAAVYGDTRGLPADETAALRPANDYGRSKIQAELILESLARSSPMRSTALRVFNLYGPGFDRSLVNRLAASSEHDVVRLTGYERFVRDYVHVSDVVNAICATLEAPGSGFCAVNIGSGVPRSNRAVIADLAEYEPLHYEIDDDIADYSAANIQRAFELLGFTPAWGERLGPVEL